MKTTSSNPQTYRKDKINKINEFIDKMPTENENLKKKTRRWLFKELLQDPLIQEAQKERRLDRMTSLTPEKLERMNQLFLQEEFESTKEKTQAFVYETEEEYDTRVNKTIAKMEEEFEKKKENLSESELKLLKNYAGIEDWKVMRYKEQVEEQKKYINDPNLKKCFIEIGNPTQKWLYNKTTSEFISLPSGWRHKSLADTLETSKTDEVVGGYLQIDPVEKIITIIWTSKDFWWTVEDFPSHACYILEKQFPWYLFSKIDIEVWSHGDCNGILDINKYFWDLVCYGSIEDCELLFHYAKMADSEFVNDNYKYTIGNFLEAYLNLLDKDRKEMPWVYPHSVALVKQDVNIKTEINSIEGNEFIEKVRNTGISMNWQVYGSVWAYYCNKLIKNIRQHNTKKIYFVDIFNELKSAAYKTYSYRIKNNKSNNSAKKYVSDPIGGMNSISNSYNNIIKDARHRPSKH